MKNITKLLTGVIVMLFVIISIVTHAGTPLPSSAPVYTLYPPTNFTIYGISYSALLNWNKPQEPGGTTPSGLLGYRIYRDGTFLHYIPDPDSLSYYDLINDFGSFTDSVTAYYELTPYGHPGEFGESIAVSGTVVIIWDSPFPFYEPWNQASFGYQMWSFIPVSGNWVINTSLGNPLPTASFTGTPAVTNYSFTLQSMPVNNYAFSCANVYFEFDSRLIVNNPTLQEKLIIEIYYDHTWHPKDTLVNDQSTAWVHHKIDITESSGIGARLGFRATGNNSADIVEWDVDNIYVYAVCFKPPDFGISKTGNIVHLTWGTPCTGKTLNPDQVDSSTLIGYNVYRTKIDSLPPYGRLNQSLLTVTGYYDTIPLVDGYYCYYVTAIYQDSNNPGSIICEPSSDTLCVRYYSGINEEQKIPVRIYPNPVSDIVNIESDQASNGIEILNFLGETVYSDSFTKTKNFNISMKHITQGIYLVKIKSGKETIVEKILKD